MADKFGLFLHDRRQIFVGRFYWQTKLANFIVRLTSALYYSTHGMQAEGNHQSIGIISTTLSTHQ